MFSKFKLYLVAVLLGLNITPATATNVQIPTCRLDKAEFKTGWFVQVGDIGTVMEVQSRIPPGSTLIICQTSYFKSSKNYKDVVIEVGKFSNANNAKKFGQRIWLEVSNNVAVTALPSVMRYTRLKYKYF